MTIYGFTVSVLVHILPIFRQLLLRNEKISIKCFETSKYSVQTADDISKLTSNLADTKTSERRRKNVLILVSKTS